MGMVSGACIPRTGQGLEDGRDPEHQSPCSHVLSVTSRNGRLMLPYLHLRLCGKCVMIWSESWPFLLCRFKNLSNCYP